MYNNICNKSIFCYCRYVRSYQNWWRIFEYFESSFFCSDFIDQPHLVIYYITISVVSEFFGNLELSLLSLDSYFKTLSYIFIMSQAYLSHKPHILRLIQEQIDLITLRNTLKLNNLQQHVPGITLSEVIECLHEFLHSYEPPLELEKLSLQNNNLTELPNNFPIIATRIRYLDLHNNDFSTFPEVICDISCLEILDLSGNVLMNLLASLVKLQNLRIISLKDNEFKYLSPVLSEMASIKMIEVGGNSLVMPSLEMIKNLQMQSPDLDWVKELKKYIHTNGAVLNMKLHEQSEQAMQKDQSMRIPPAILRSKSISDTRTSASRAARRMGLIIKKPKESGNLDSNPDSSDQFSSLAPTVKEQNISLPLLSSLPQQSLSASATQTEFKISTPPLSNFSGALASTVPNSQSSSLHPSPSDTPVSFNRPSSRNRSRSNTFKEIDRMLEKSNIADTEHKSGAYFRRLSTLQELPSDENNSSHASSISTWQNSYPNSSTSMSSRDRNSHQHRRSDSQPTSSSNGKADIYEAIPEIPATNTSTFSKSSNVSSITGSSKVELSPSRNHTIHQNDTFKKGIDSAALIKASRKVLFSFSELHSSVRRFTGFCIDKKITIKMVSLLYTAKSNIDSLVENLEIMEENNDNISQINNALLACISSFRSIMSLLSENFSNFVIKIDVCFIRMLYLNLYGSFNELLNAYQILHPNPSFKIGQGTTQATNTSTGTSLSSLDPKGATMKQPSAINTNTMNDADDDIDENLYQSIEIATSNAQVVFSELTKAIGKTAVASTTSGPPKSQQQISHILVSKVKELTSVCISSMDITKRLKTKLITIRNNPSHTTMKLFWDDINLFLKAIIQTFSSVKVVMKDLPILNEIRPFMATLTKTTKDVTILLEVSSYKSMSSDYASSSSSTAAPPQLASIASVSNIFAPASPHPHPLQNSSHSLANLTQLGNPTFSNNAPGPSQHSTRAPAFSVSGSFGQNHVPTSSIETPGGMSTAATNAITGGASVTAPAQSTGQYFAKNGMNPFDGLILANGNKAEIPLQDYE